MYDIHKIAQTEMVNTILIPPARALIQFPAAAGPGAIRTSALRFGSQSALKKRQIELDDP